MNAGSSGACPGIARGGGGQNISTISGPKGESGRKACGARGIRGMFPRENFENRVVFLYSVDKHCCSYMLMVN